MSDDTFSTGHEEEIREFFFGGSPMQFQSSIYSVSIV